jgi:chemotaxis protein histidine kinase CheA
MDVVAIEGVMGAYRFECEDGLKVRNAILSWSSVKHGIVVCDEEEYDTPARRGSGRPPMGRQKSASNITEGPGTTLTCKICCSKYYSKSGKSNICRTCSAGHSSTQSKTHRTAKAKGHKLECGNVKCGKYYYSKSGTSKYCPVCRDLPELQFEPCQLLLAMPPTIEGKLPAAQERAPTPTKENKGREKASYSKKAAAAAEVQAEEEERVFREAVEKAKREAKAEKAQKVAEDKAEAEAERARKEAEMEAAEEARVEAEEAMVKAEEEARVKAEEGAAEEVRLVAEEEARLEAEEEAEIQARMAELELKFQQGKAAEVERAKLLSTRPDLQQASQTRTGTEQQERSSRPPPAAAPISIQAWLTSVNPSLTQYEQGFQDEGYDNLPLLLCADEEDLNEALDSIDGLKKPHRKLIYKAAILLKSVCAGCGCKGLEMEADITKGKMYCAACTGAQGANQTQSVHAHPRLEDWQYEEGYYSGKVYGRAGVVDGELFETNYTPEEQQHMAKEGGFVVTESGTRYDLGRAAVQSGNAQQEWQHQTLEPTSQDLLWGETAAPPTRQAAPMQAAVPPLPKGKKKGKRQARPSFFL